jgi:hypothetical protein
MLVLLQEDAKFWWLSGDKAHKAYAYIMNQVLSQAHPQLPG